MRTIADIEIVQASSVSTDIKVIPTNVSMPAGESPRVLIIVSEDVSRAKWLCHRYVRTQEERRGGLGRKDEIC